MELTLDDLALKNAVYGEIKIKEVKRVRRCDCWLVFFFHLAGFRPAQASLVWERFSQHYEISSIYRTHKTVLKILLFTSSFGINKHNNLYFPYSTDVYIDTKNTAGTRVGPGGHDQMLAVKKIVKKYLLFYIFLILIVESKHECQ